MEALRTAAGRCRPEPGARLTDRGLLPWINYRTEDGQTPVMSASLAGHAEVENDFVDFCGVFHGFPLCIQNRWMLLS